MQKDKIKLQLQELIAKSNTYLNSGNKQQITAYLYIIFSLLALSFFGLFAVGPTITTISELNKQFKDDTAALQKLKEKNAALKSLGIEISELGNDLPLLEKAIPNSPQVAELTRQLEYIATAKNLTISKLDTGLMELYPANSSTTPLFSFTFSVSISGDDSSVNDFIKEFINMGRIIKIDKLTTGRQQDDAFAASITGRAFFYKN